MEKQAEAPRIWPWCLLCLVTALVVSLGDIHQHHNSDSLLPILESLYRWEPYFWIQNRVGMLVPLLAIPIESPLANLLFQSTLDLFLGLLAVLLLARYLLRDRTYPLVAVVSIALLLGLCPSHTTWYIFLDCLSGVWLGLGLGGLVLLQTETCGRTSWRRQLLALVLLVLAHWVYISAFVLLGPLVVFRFLLCGSSPYEVGCKVREFWQATSSRNLRKCFWIVLNNEGTTSVALLVVSLALGRLFSHLSPKPYHSLKFDQIPVGRWAESWRMLIHNSWVHVLPHTWYYFLLGVAALGFLASFIPAARVHQLRAWRGAVAVLATALVYVAVLGTRDHIYQGNCDYHYCFPAIFLAQAGLVIVGVGPLARSLPAISCRRLEYIGIPVVFAAAIGNYGMPSTAAVRASLDRISQVGHKSEDVLSARATHIVGNYWSVWATMFRSNLTRYELGQPPVWGITYRSEPTWKYWSRVPVEEMRVAVPLGEEEEAESLVRAFGLPEMQAVERWGSVTIWRPKGLPAR